MWYTVQGCSKTICLCLSAIQLSRLYPGAVLGTIHQLVSAGQHVAFTNFCTTFSCTCFICYAILCNTHFIHLFIQWSLCWRLSWSVFAETVSARCWVNRLTLCCCFCIDLYREVFLLFSLPCNINRVDEIIKPSICTVPRHYTVLSTNNQTVTMVGKYTFKQT